jgi:tellurite resistance protein TerC
MHSIILWVGFNIFIFFLLTFDLKVLNRNPHEISIKESLIWSGVWIGLSLLFNIGVYSWFGRESALQFFTGYLIEKSLSIDNLFVFVLLFSYFKVPPRYQHKVLYWGIIGALIMRGILILLGAALITRFHWILYLFGIFLVITGVKMAFQTEKQDVHPERNFVVRFFKKFFPVTPGYDGQKFFVKKEGKSYATLLFIVLIVIETTDLLFAIDSIPAIFAITQDSFVIYTSNVFAILGLRSLYFALAGIMELFYYLRHGLSVVLTFIGLKMLLMGYVNIPIGVALGVVGTVLLVAVAASIIRARIQKKKL